MKTLVKRTAILLSAYMFLMYSPTLLDYNPTEYFIPFPDFDGPLLENYELSKSEKLYAGSVNGPESIVFHEGYMYTGLADGRIVKIKGDEMITVAQTGSRCELPYEERKCGRPLGMRIGKDGLLYLVDAYFGILSMNFTTGALTKVLPSSILVNGERVNFPDDLDIDVEGNIYFSDASRKWDLTTLYYMIVEYENGGRIIRFNIHTKESEVLLSNLHFPNGVQINGEKDALLFAEFLNRRIMKYYLKGPKKGQLEVFTDNLPGEPDNLRLNPRGGYWVAITSARNSSNYLLIDSLNSYPKLKRVWGRLQSAVGSFFWALANLSGSPLFKKYAYFVKRGDVVLPLLPRHGLVVELDHSGHILRSLHSPDGKIYGLSEVKEHNGYLYLGSFVNEYLGRYKL